MLTAILVAAGLAVAAPVEEDAPPARPDAEADTDAPSADAPPRTTRREAPYRWGGLALPLVGFNSVDGFGVGLGGEFYDRKRGEDFGYRNKFQISTYWTTTGAYNSNFFQYERRGKHLFFLRLLYRAWQNMIYVGSGGADVLVDLPADISTGNRVYGPQGTIGGVFRIPNAPVFLWTQAYGRFVVVAPDPGGRLAQDRPTGVDGGFYFDTSVGLTVEEVDRWPMPRKGVRFETSVRMGGFTRGGFQPLAGVNAELTGWLPVIGDHLVIGSRTLFDKSWGARPFWEREWLGGQYRDEVAYEQAFTGYGRTRTRGDGHFATMIELRSFLYRTRHPVADFAFYFSVYGEWGYLFDGGDPGPPMPTVGVAPYIVYQGAVRLRPFASWGWLAEVPGGTRRPQAQFGIALVEPL